MKTNAVDRKLPWDLKPEGATLVHYPNNAVAFLQRVTDHAFQAFWDEPRNHKKKIKLVDKPFGRKIFK